MRTSCDASSKVRVLLCEVAIEFIKVKAKTIEINSIPKESGLFMKDLVFVIFFVIIKILIINSINKSIISRQ